MLPRLWRKGNFSTLLVGTKTGVTSMENSTDVSQKLTTTIWSSNSAPGYTSKNKNTNSKKVNVHFNDQRSTVYSCQDEEGHWQSHQDQDAYQTSEGGWPPQAGCKVSNSGKRVAQQIPIWKALAYRWYLKPWIWGDYLQAIHSGDLHIMTFNSKKHKHQRSRVCIGNSGLLTSWSPC